MMQVFNLVGASFTVVMLLMLCCWLVYLVQRRANIVDVAWGLGFVVSAWMYFILGTGNFLKMLVMAGMVTIWGGRLACHLWKRYRSNIKEDPRYQGVLEQWDPDSARLFYLMLFIFQGVLVVILSLPFFLVARGSHAPWMQVEVWGIVLWLIGIGGETVADNQLAEFQKDPANQGKVCQKGLWYYSRHPNYFFECVLWFGYALFALPADWGWLAFISPILMLLLIFKISGIPLTEAQAVRSKGDLYREYQRTTSVFVPWFPKKLS